MDVPFLLEWARGNSGLQFHASEYLAGGLERPDRQARDMRPLQRRTAARSVPESNASAARSGPRYFSILTNHSPTARLAMLRPAWTCALFRKQPAREMDTTPAQASGHRSDRRLG